ncbi:MAG: PHB depolymerase family esterase [Chitinophagaceae bacterium]
MRTVQRFAFACCIAATIFSSCKKDNSLSAAQVADNLPETAPAVQTAVTANITSRIGGFYKALPARYDSTTKKYPLLIFLHGVGELGNGTSDLPRLLNNAVPRLLNQKTFPAQFTVNGANYSFIVINPQFKEWPQATDVNAMIDYAVANYRVDQSRIYVAGLSMGGGNTWDYAVAYANRIAAIVPICGASWPSKDQLGNIAKANLPVWAFHNNDDGTVGVNTTISNVDNINSFNPAIPAKKTIWPYGGHDAWTKATNPATKECDGKNMYEWMLQYKRDLKQ